MEDKETRLKNLENEDFYFILFEGTRMPNNPRFLNITIFNDVFYVENEVMEKEYLDLNIIFKIKKFLKSNIIKIENIDQSRKDYPKSSSHFQFKIKINGKEYFIDRLLCRNEKNSEYIQITKEILRIIGIGNKSENKLVELIDIFRQKKNGLSFKEVIDEIKISKFYCPVRISDNKKEIATIKNSNNDSLLVAFTSKDELNKWNIKSDPLVKIKIFNFNIYSDILLEDENNNFGLVINPFGVNFVLDKKMISDMKKIM